jgi:DNA ligase D-like protein (predicted ligase)
MLARIGSRFDLDREGYVFEPKVDGIRAVCEKRDGRLQFFNRTCRDVTARYPELDFARSLDAGTCVLDGEIVRYGPSGGPDFTALMQRHLGTDRIRAHDRAIRYVAFDVVRMDGRDLTRLPLAERKEILRQTIARHPHLEIVAETRDGHRLWNLIEERGLEGVMAKNASSRYAAGRRSSAWLKIKAFQTLDAVIVGFTTERRPVSALALAAYAGHELRFIGKVGTGMGDVDIQVLRDKLEPLEIDGEPCMCPARYRNVRWVKPRIVCEVRYLEFGRQGMLRNPSFVRLRPDKQPRECRVEPQST